VYGTSGVEGVFVEVIEELWDLWYGWKDETNMTLDTLGVVCHSRSMPLGDRGGRNSEATIDKHYGVG